MFMKWSSLQTSSSNCTPKWFYGIGPKVRFPPCYRYISESLPEQGTKTEFWNLISRFGEKEVNQSNKDCLALEQERITIRIPLGRIAYIRITSSRTSLLRITLTKITIIKIAFTCFKYIKFTFNGMKINISKFIECFQF